PTAARYGRGLQELLQAVHEVATGKVVCRPRRVQNEPRALRVPLDRLTQAILEVVPALPNARWVAMRLLDGDKRITEALRSGELGAGEGTPQASPEEVIRLAEELRWQVGRNFHDQLVETVYTEAARLADRAVQRQGEKERFDLDRTIDRLVTSRRWGFPIMIALFALVFWLTITGANYPSQMLFDLLIGKIYPWLQGITASIGFPWWLRGVLVDGMYLATAWVVSVMLPPMAIFFPLFTMLEDFGYLPRLAFNLDPLFRRAGAHGRQALSMMMGFGCNAAGVVATRIIDSPRERLIAIITNNFALCNGRWPTQILIASLFIGSLVPAYLAGFISALAVVGIALLGVLFTFLTSWALSRTLLKGEVSTFSLELPPYRPPRFWQTIYTSLIDRTIYVLWRAVKFAMPAGAVIWLIANVSLRGEPLAAHLVRLLDPVGMLIGLNGIILVAYLVAIPANEIVIPTVLMLTVLLHGVPGVSAGSGVLLDVQDQATLMSLFQAGGWTLLTAVNLMLFSLIHNPCSTTIATIYKETGSKKWTAIATLMPVLLGLLITFSVAQIWRLVS
ncbi:MAG: ferrous iron transporter B, partial [Anaerolineae bacterium]